MSAYMLSKQLPLLNGLEWHIETFLSWILFSILDTIVINHIYGIEIAAILKQPCQPSSKRQILQ